MAQRRHTEWTKILETVRSFKDAPLDADSFLDEIVQSHAGEVRSQLKLYATRLAIRQDCLDKTCIRDTRLALRVALACHSILGNACRRKLQDATRQWVVALLPVLHVPSGDSKVRYLSAQLLCNSITTHSENADILVSRISLEPSSQAIANRLCENPPTSQIMNDPYNWVDFLLVAASSRPSLGTVVAVLHNVVIQQEDGYIEKVASNALLICTLLRHLVGVQSMKPFATLQSDDGKIDPATEWIQIILGLFSRRGFLPQMYTSSGAISHNTGVAMPEQVVLLHCIQDLVADGQDQTIFGSEDKPSCRAILFLADEVDRIQSTPAADAEKALTGAVLPLLLGILADSLSTDTPRTTKMRQHLAASSRLLVEVSNQLALVVDEVTQENEGKLSRHMNLSENQKRLLISCVRLVGNMCFHSATHQNLLRETVIPGRGAPERTALHVLLNSTGVQHACFSLREWAVLAVRYALEGCPANQEAVEKLKALSPMNSAELQGMGVKVELQGAKVSVTAAELRESES